MNKFSTIFVIYLLISNVVFLVHSNSKLKNNEKKIHLKNKVQSTKSFKNHSSSKTQSNSYLKKSSKSKNKTKNGEISLEVWEKCANEGENCNFSGTTIVRYGAQGSFVYREATNSFYCSYTHLGDPKYGVHKHCYIKKNRYEWKNCSGENGRCNFSGTTAVRYGADGSFSYKTATNGIDCNNGVFGDPRGGVYKYCYVLVDDFWAQCAGENGYCSFKGSSIVRYGADGGYLFKEVTDGQTCSYIAFGGDPKYGVHKYCHVRQGAYSWVKCANENETCQFPGKVIVRYGEKTSFTYKYAENSIGCNNSTFGDPIGGIVKKCEYALFAVGGEAEAMDNLAKQDQECDNEPNTSCGRDAGFGFNGFCLSQPFGNSRNGVPADTMDSIKFLWELNQILGLNFDFCMGDYDGKTLQTSNRLSYQKCNEVPLMEDYKYGTISGSVGNVTGCGASPVNISMCINFDQCGTVSVMIDSGLAQCAATYSTGIAAILSPVSDVLDFVGLGISPKRRFSLKFDVAYREGDDVGTKEVTTFGHFYFKIGFALPLNDIKIAGKRLKEVFSLNLDALIMIDFGNSFNLFNDVKNIITSANRNTALNFFNNINNNTQFEMTMQVKGAFTINLGALTRGFFPDLSINLLTTNLLFTNGNCGPSGLSKGVYFYLARGFNNISEVIQLVVDQFKDLFSIFGVTVTVPSFTLNFTFGFFLTDDSIGVKIAGPGFSLFCIYIYGKGGSCGFNFSFFTAILEAAKWVIKHARQLFDDTGKAVVEMSNEVGKFSINAANTVANFFRGDFRDFFERDVKNALTNSAGAVGSFFQNDVGGAINDAGQVLGSAGNTVVGGLETAGNTIAGGFVSAGNAIASAFSGW